MKLKTFLKSVSILVLVFLIIMALFRGPESQWLMICALSLWAAFIVGLLIKTMFSKIFGSLGAFFLKTMQGGSGYTDTSQMIAENREIKIALINQIAMRITENLQYCYPDAAWKWADKNPLEKLLNQETCRISISNLPEFNFADVQTDKKGGLNFEFGKKVSLNEIRQTVKEEKTDAEEPSAEYGWLQAEGGKLLSNLICELSSAGCDKFYISSNGEISIINGEEPQVLITDFNVPAVSLEKLKELLKTLRLNSEIDGDKLTVSVI